MVEPDEPVQTISKPRRVSSNVNVDVLSSQSEGIIQALGLQKRPGVVHPTQPLLKGEPLFREVGEGHILFGSDWKITDKGEFININMEKIKVQSGALKLIIKRMGRNLLTGKSLINMSLPIEIFGTDSNIERICKGYIYAPNLVEKMVSMNHPIDRMKYGICFGLTFSVSYIEMQKPFNPILGETYQAMIDGCPVYAEQISHHPPIGNTYFVGRGYKIHGSFESKVEMGMNSASGINYGYNHIEFDDGGSLKFNTPFGEMSGIIYGDRQLCLVKKSYYVDEPNRLFCEVQWGKNKNSKNRLANMQDYFEGSICLIK